MKEIAPEVILHGWIKFSGGQQLPYVSLIALLSSELRLSVHDLILSAGRPPEEQLSIEPRRLNVQICGIYFRQTRCLTLLDGSGGH